MDIRKDLGSQFIMMLLGSDVRKIGHLVDKVRRLLPELRDLEDIKVYQDKYLLPLDEEAGVINTQEDVIIIPRVGDAAIKNEYVEEDVKPVIT